MALPIELQRIPDETVIVGDVDAFMTYIETEQAERDWHMLVEMRKEEARKQAERECEQCDATEMV